MISTWHGPEIPGEDVDALFLPGFVRALEALGTAPALAVLRALGAVAAPRHAAAAQAAAGRLAAAGLPEPAWAGELAPPKPTAALLVHEEAFDDGVSVVVEFGSHTLGVYVDHNLGGLVKDVFLAGSLAEVRESFTTPGVSLRELDLAEARARVEAALYELDHTLDPPVAELGALWGKMRLTPNGQDPGIVLRNRMQAWLLAARAHPSSPMAFPIVLLAAVARRRGIDIAAANYDPSAYGLGMLETQVFTGALLRMPKGSVKVKAKRTAHASAFTSCSDVIDQWLTDMLAKYGYKGVAADAIKFCSRRTSRR